MIGLAALLLTGLVVLWGAAVLLSLRILMHPPRRTYSAAVARGRPGDPSELPESRAFESWTLERRGVRMAVWDIPGDAPGGPTVILTHGWADSKIGGLVRLPALVPVASRIVLWDLPGHGESTGTCRLGTVEVGDVFALMDRVSAERVVLMGWSLGAGVSLAAAVERPEVVGVIAEAPYRFAPTPAANVLRARGLPAALIVPAAFGIMRLVLGGSISNRVFDRTGLARRVRRPVLVIHGREDIVCPAEDGREVAAASGGDLIEISGAGHNDLWIEGACREEATAAVQKFVRRVSAAESSRESPPA